jgi:hypothetical protein
MMKSSRADSLKLCYIFAYPPSAGIESHVNNTSIHPLCDDACQAKHGPEFVNIGIDNKELQYWLPTLLSQSICPPGYEEYNILHTNKSVAMPGSWIKEHDEKESHLFLSKEQEGK